MLWDNLKTHFSAQTSQLQYSPNTQHISCFPGSDSLLSCFEGHLRPVLHLIYTPSPTPKHAHTSARALFPPLLLPVRVAMEGGFLCCHDNVRSLWSPLTTAKQSRQRPWMILERCDPHSCCLSHLFYPVAKKGGVGRCTQLPCLD